MLQLICVVLVMIAGLFWYNFQNHNPAKHTDPLEYVAEDVNIHPLPTGNTDVPPDAMTPYNTSKEAMAKSDFTLAELLLNKAVEVKPDFTEAWYTLSITQEKRSIQMMKEANESKSLAYYRKAMDSKKKAYALMQENKWFEYDKDQQTQTISDVKTNLTEAEKVLADEPALISKLKNLAK